MPNLLRRVPKGLSQILHFSEMLAYGFIFYGRAPVHITGQRDLTSQKPLKWASTLS